MQRASTPFSPQRSISSFHPALSMTKLPLRSSATRFLSSSRLPVRGSLVCSQQLSFASRIYPAARRKLAFRAHCSTLRDRAPITPSHGLLGRRDCLETLVHRYSPLRSLVSTALVSKRHCSCRRTMFGEGLNQDAVHGSISAAQGRELLPANVKPVHYDLTLEPNFESFTYDGQIVIDLSVVEETRSITLHTLELKVHKAIVKSGSDVVSSQPELSYDDDKQTTTISFDRPIAHGTSAQLGLDFTGELNDKMAGFYRSSYKDSASGAIKYLATTQMEPTDGRRAFPCFDEPALKATFDITLIADKHLTCLSNMDVASEKEAPSKAGSDMKKAVRFNTSPRMSTYLVAFIVGELNYVETTNFRVPIRVYATPDKEIEHGRFAVDLAARTLDFYEKTFDSAFPLPKMDMVAIPDFSAGAMENWGLVTYRVVDVLFDEKASGASVKERVAETVQHELAHQWFGNLVTMDFWDGLWLNEGFATWMSWYSCNHFYPEWKVWETYVTDNLASALSLDSLRSSHPVEVPVKRADEINQIFDSISYAKGSAVLRMISKFLGEDTFMEGIRRYLKKHAYGNTKTEDLWAALSDASGKDIRAVMDIWTKKVGYPVITVTEDAPTETIRVRQNRFLRTGDVKPEEDQTLYPVFLNLRTKEGVDEGLTLYDREAEIKLTSLDFFKLNAEHAGIYRTCYAPDRLVKLGAAAKDGLLPVEDRTGMVGDAGALAAAGYQQTSALLGLLKGFHTEPEYVVWAEVLGRVQAVKAAWLFEAQDVKDGLTTFQRLLLTDKAREIGWDFKEDNGHLLQQFKALMFGAAGFAHDKTVVEAAFDMFNRFAKGDRSAIHPNIRGSVYGIALRNGGEKEYDVVLNESRTAKNSDERNGALRSLGCARDPKLIQRTLKLALSDEVKEQDIYLPLGALRGHVDGVEALWQWMQDNWTTLEKKLPPGLSMLGSVVSICTSGFTKAEHIDAINGFFKHHSTKGFDQNLAQSLDAIRTKASWVKRDDLDLRGWLFGNGYLSK